MILKFLIEVILTVKISYFFDSNNTCEYNVVNSLDNLLIRMLQCLYQYFLKYLFVFGLR